MEINDEIKEYKMKLRELKQGYEKTFQDFSKELGLMTPTIRNAQSKIHFDLSQKINMPNKVKKDNENALFNNIFWAGEGSNHGPQIAAATSTGYCLIYNFKTNKFTEEVFFTNSELNTCCIEPTENSLMAAGGFDGGIYVININAYKAKDKNEANKEEAKKFPGHQGFVSCCRFLNPFYLVSSSFDSVINLWDINSQGKSLNSYHDHNSEVSGLDVNDINGNIFATGSGDTTVKLWDIREKKACVCTFKGSNSNVSCVKFLPGRLTTLAAGSEDSSIRLYDLRALKELSCFKKDGEFNSINSIGFSKSGQVLFESSNNSSKINFWDVLDDKTTPFHTYTHTDSCNKGVRQVCIDSTGNNLAYITENVITILK